MTRADCDDEDDECESSSLLEERNNVAHSMHVVFATYRQYAYPWQLFAEMIRQKPSTSAKQINFVLFYWLNNYPEDFWTACQPRTRDEANNESSGVEQDNESLYSEYTSSSSSYTGSSSLNSTLDSATTTTSTNHFSPMTLADQLISIRQIDEEVKKHCLHLLDMKKENSLANRTMTYSTIHVSPHTES